MFIAWYLCYITKQTVLPMIIRGEKPGPDLNGNKPLELKRVYENVIRCLSPHRTRNKNQQRLHYKTVKCFN